MRYHHSSLIVGLLSVCLFASSATAASDREVTIWEVAVVPFQGEVKGVPGQRLATGLARQFQDTRRFKVRSPERVLGAFKKLTLDPRQPLSREDAARLAEQLGVDGVFTGTFSATDEKTLQLDLTLRTSSGTPYRTTSTTLVRPITPVALKDASAQISKALPWDAVIVRVDGHHGLINAGEAQGLKLSQRLSVFEYGKVKDNKDGYEVDAPRGLTEVSIIRLSKQAAWVLRIRGEELQANRKVSIEDVDLATPGPGGVAKKRKTKANRLEVASSFDMLIRSYELRSDPFDVESTSTAFAAPRIAARWIPVSFGFADVLVRADYRHGFMPYRSTDDTTGNVTTFSGSLDQASAEAGVSKTLGGTGRMSGTEFHLLGGYRMHRFAIEEQTPLVLTSDTYQQVTVAAGASVPVFELLRQRRWRFFLFSDVRYAPLVTLTQDPVDLGDGSILALQGEIGVRTRIVKKLHVSVGWTVDYLSGEFSDATGGSRGFVNARSTDLYQGLVLRADYVLFR